MAQVKVISASLTKDGYFLVVDDNGRLWRAMSLNGGHWYQIILPEEPKETSS
jgi:hypothetical protein